MITLWALDVDSNTTCLIAGFVGFIGIIWAAYEDNMDYRRKVEREQMLEPRTSIREPLPDQGPEPVGDPE